MLFMNMKTFLVFLCSFCLGAAGFAQDPAPAAAGDVAAPATQTATAPFSQDELDQLLGPVALYPDPLIGLILPASTVPADVVMADRYLQQNGDPALIPNQSWDDTVKGLTHYPDVLKWLDDNLAWTTQLGSAYLAQPDDVLASIQRLRARARADGTLRNSDQQQVGVEDGEVTIEPANPNQIYVPQYNTDAVYDDEYTLDDGQVITFGAPYAVGPWLNYWPDWWHSEIYYGDRRRWRAYRDTPGVPNNDPAVHLWRADPGRANAAYHPRAVTGSFSLVVQPHLAAGVTIAAPRHPGAASHPQFVTVPQRDFTGRGVVPPPRGVAGVVVSHPGVVVQSPAGSVVTGYGRGNEAWAASQRGQFSRQAAFGGQAPVQPAGRGAGTFQGNAGAGSQGQGTGNGQGRWGH